MKKWVFLITAISLLLLTCFTTVPTIANETNPIKGGNVIYVDDDSPSPGNGSIEWPYSKIEYAIQNSTDGDTINVYSGSYLGYYTIEFQKYVSIIGNSSKNTFISSTSGDVCFYIGHSENILIKNFTFQNIGPVIPSVSIASLDSSYVNIEKCVIDNSEYGICFHTTDNSTAKNCTLKNMIIDGILISQYANNNKVLNCEIFNCGEYGIHLISSSKNLIKGNTIKNNKKDGIHLISGSNENIITCNHIEGNHRYGIGFGNIWDIVLKAFSRSKNNIIYKNNFYDNGRIPRIFNGFELFTLIYKNYWYNGTVGNYWHNSIYTKLPRLYDPDGDGICNRPYFIFFIRRDKYPLMEPVEINSNNI